MHEESWKTQVSNLHVNQYLDNTYDKLYQLLFSEMDLQYKITPNKKVRKALKPHKPYWDNKLAMAWRILREKQKRI